eukprot:3595813-Heterocapsa_arctica.AAC.1
MSRSTRTLTAMPNMTRKRWVPRFRRPPTGWTAKTAKKTTSKCSTVRRRRMSFTIFTRTSCRPLMRPM